RAPRRPLQVGIEVYGYDDELSLIHAYGTTDNVSATGMFAFVDTGLPGFSKSFSPSTVALGGRSTLTLTIDNSANLSAVIELDFTDTLPGGMVIAAPALASTTCGTATIPPTLTAIPGTDTIVLDANGTAGFPAIAVGATCAVDVDVVGGAVGLLGNVSDNLLASFVEAGKAAAVLEVTGVVDLLELSKEFIDDPVAPGGMVTLEFTVTNKSRTDSATGITFIDDLEAALSGLVPTLPPTPDPPCGVGSALILAPPPPPLRTVFPDVLTLTGGTLPAESSCTFSVELSVPGTAAPGTYPNTTSAVSGTVGGSPETGNTASDLLFVVAFPVLTKEFTDDPVAAGDSVTLEFTISNPGSAAMTGITFGDELTDNSGGLGGGLGNGFLPFPVSVTIPPGEPCGTGSSLALVSFGTDRQGLELTGGSLAATGMAGDSCTFSVSVDIPVGFAGGTYLNTTEEISATVAMATVVGPQASDSIVVASAPTLTKEFEYGNPMQVPRLTKIVVNIGLGEALTNSKAVDAAVGDLTIITGQKPVTTRA
ncbi:MAG: 50S ribosomal protein L5, partial [Thermoanaerobaculia bacterium]